MARIFISHSSKDNAKALAIEQWLIAQGWGEPFLDINPQEGIPVAQRWRTSLNVAAQRCDVVLILLSPAWIASGECIGEFAFASYLGKTILSVIVDAAVDMRAVPTEMRSWQMCDLIKGERTCTFAVAHDPLVPLTEVVFSEAGLEQLQRGLQGSSLSANEFPWPPPHEPHRSPYRGLKPLEAEDAAIYFGRQSAITGTIATLRQLRETHTRLFLILGASGAGKSSFLRAGLWPRLHRDDRHFHPLPVIRPGRAAITGPTGLAAALEQAYATLAKPRTRGAILEQLRQDDGLDAIVCDLNALTRRGLEDDDVAPALVFFIDQAEELYSHGTDGTMAEGTQQDPARTKTMEEALEFRRALHRLLTLYQPCSARPLAMLESPLVIATVRSDAYECIQTEPRLAEIPHRPFNLPPLSLGEYERVIHGPAEVATKNGRPLAVEAALADRLLDEAQGADALPLLSFILERLHSEFGRDGNLLLSEYEKLGGLRGCIQAVIEQAFDQPDTAPVIPTDPTHRDRLLRQAFIPWLVTLDIDTGVPQRHVACRRDIAAEAHPLLDRLIEKGLLVEDTRMDSETNKPIDVLEVAHEALLRQWEQLVQWIQEDRIFLLWKQRLNHDLQGWEQQDRAPQGLQTAFRLKESCRWLADRRSDLRDVEQTYIARSLRRRRTRQVVTGAVGLSLACALMAVTYVGISRFLVQPQEIQTAVATILDSVGTLTQAQEDPGTAALLLTELSQPVLDQTNKYFEALVAARTVLAQPLPDAIFRVPDQTGAGETQGPRGATVVHMAPNERQLVVGYRDGTARIWSLGASAPTHHLKGMKGEVVVAQYSPDGHWILAGGHNDKVARLWNADDPTAPPRELKGHTGWINHAAFCGVRPLLATAADDGTALLWDLPNHDTAASSRVLTPRHTLSGHTGGITTVAFSPDCERLATGSHDQTIREWTGTGTFIEEHRGHQRVVSTVAYSADGRWLVSASLDDTARIWEPGSSTARITLKGHSDDVLHARFSPLDAATVVTTSNDHTARIWKIDPAAGTASTVHILRGHVGAIRHALFTADAARVITISTDGTARVWDLAEQGQASILRGHTGPVTAAGIAPRSDQLLTASVDGTVRLWNLGEPSEPRRLKHDAYVNSVAYLPQTAADSSPASTVTGSEDGRILRWFLDEPGKRVEIGRHAKWVRSVAASPDGTRIVSASQDGTAVIWTLNGNNKTPSITLPHASAVISAVFSPDGTEVLTTTEAGEIRIWSAGDGSPRCCIGTHGGSVMSGAYTADGTRLITASLDGTAKVWRHDGRFVQVPIAIAEGSAKVQLIHAAVAPGPTPGTHLLVTSTNRGTVHLWQLTLQDGAEDTVTFLQSVQGHDDIVTSAVFAPHGRALLTTSDDLSARLWPLITVKGLPAIDTQHALVLRGHRAALRHAAFSPDSRTVVTVANDQMAYVWRMDWEDLRSYLRRRITACMTLADLQRYSRLRAETAQQSVASCEHQLVKQGTSTIEAKEPPPDRARQNQLPRGERVVRIAYDQVL